MAAISVSSFPAAGDKKQDKPHKLSLNTILGRVSISSFSRTHDHRNAIHDPSISANTPKSPRNLSMLPRTSDDFSENPHSLGAGFISRTFSSLSTLPRTTQPSVYRTRTSIETSTPTSLARVFSKSWMTRRAPHINDAATHPPPVLRTPSPSIPGCFSSPRDGSVLKRAISMLQSTEPYAPLERSGDYSIHRLDTRPTMSPTPSAEVDGQWYTPSPCIKKGLVTSVRVDHEDMHLLGSRPSRSSFSSVSTFSALESTMYSHPLPSSYNSDQQIAANKGFPRPLPPIPSPSVRRTSSLYSRLETTSVIESMAEITARCWPPISKPPSSDDSPLSHAINQYRAGSYAKANNPENLPPPVPFDVGPMLSSARSPLPRNHCFDESTASKFSQRSFSLDVSFDFQPLEIKFPVSLDDPVVDEEPAPLDTSSDDDVFTPKTSIGPFSWPLKVLDGHKDQKGSAEEGKERESSPTLFTSIIPTSRDVWITEPSSNKADVLRPFWHSQGTTHWSESATTEADQSFWDDEPDYIRAKRRAASSPGVQPSSEGTSTWTPPLSWHGPKHFFDNQSMPVSKSVRKRGSSTSRLEDVVRKSISYIHTNASMPLLWPSQSEKEKDEWELCGDASDEDEWSPEDLYRDCGAPQRMMDGMVVIARRSPNGSGGMDVWEEQDLREVIPKLRELKIPSKSKKRR